MTVNRYSPHHPVIDMLGWLLVSKKFLYLVIEILVNFLFCPLLFVLQAYIRTYANVFYKFVYFTAI